MKTAAAYIRVSTEDQTEYSPDSQLKAIRKYAKEHDLILPEEFIFMDEGISGRKADKRPSFQRMIGTAKLKPKPFDVILLWKFSRFARNREDSIVYKSMLRKQCGIEVVSISEQLSEDKTSILIEALIEAMDEYYSLNLAEEVRRGMQEKFSRGGVVSQPPFGYRMGDGVFVPDETNAPIVQMIFNDFVSGVGARQIAAKLNDMGIRSTKGNKFENRTIEYILTNPAYIGKLRRSPNGRDPLDRFHESPDTQLVDGKHEPLITEELFQKAQAKRSENKSLYGKYERHAPVEFMLKGLVRCSNCGATLTHQSAGNSIQCHHYARGACKVSHAMTLKKINALVVERIKSDLMNGLVDVNIHDMNSEAKPETPVGDLLNKEHRKLERVREAYEAGVDTLDEYRHNKEKIQSRIAELEAMIKPEPAEPRDVKKLLAKRIQATLDIIESEDSSETVKNMSLRSIVYKIIFVKPKSVIEIFYKV
ncbi:MAG: recombinase family protein [Ruminococcus sp.]|nr:recombinase family protein [Ruminococcus sp.]